MKNLFRTPFLVKKIISIHFLLILIIQNTSAQSWSEPYIAESINGVGGSLDASSMQIVNGNPAVAYHDVTHKNLLFVRATNIDGTAWGMPVLVDWMGVVGQSCVLQVVNGNPAIVFSNFTDGQVYYVRATDANGDGWGTPQSIGTFSNSNPELNFSIISGNPAVSFCNEGNNNLNYIRATDIDGISWGAPISIGSATRAYSLLAINGNPAICFHFGSDFKYVRATDAVGTAWGTPVTLFASSTIINFGSMQIVNGNPAVAYMVYSGAGELTYQRASDANGDSWNAAVTVFSGFGIQNSRLLVVSGNPAVFYRNGNSDHFFNRATDADGASWGANQNLGYDGNSSKHGFSIVNSNPAMSGLIAAGGFHFKRAADADGASWLANAPIATATEDGGFYPSANLVAGMPAFCYNSYGYSSHFLKYARATNLSGSAWSPPVLIADITNQLSTGNSLEIISGNPAVGFNMTGLKYARAANTTGSSWGTPISLTTAHIYGADLETINSNPAIAFCGNNNAGLQFIRASDGNGASWGSVQVLDAAADNDYPKPSLKTVNGNPAVAYKSIVSGQNRLNFIRSSDANGSSWGTPISILIESPGYLQMQIVGGNPAIAYQNNTYATLNFIRANDANGTSWPTMPQILVNTGCENVHFEIISGKPAITFSVGNNLNVILATNTNGTSWGAPQTISTGSNSNNGLSNSLFASSSNQAGLVFYNYDEAFPLFTSAQIALPLELTAFRADYQKSNNRLFWKTASENNTDRFEVERSESDKNDFEIIGSVAASGFSNESKNYEFIDREPTIDAYYRLKMIDRDGFFDYSNLVFLKRKNSQTLQVFPNPVVDTNLEIHFENKEGGFEIQIFDALGQLIFRKIGESTGESQNEKVNMEGFAPGVYRIELWSQSGRQSINFLVD